MACHQWWAFQPNHPNQMDYYDHSPQQIRDEFAELWQEEVIGKEYLLRALSNYVSTDILASFMDDLAMGRV